MTHPLPQPQTPGLTSDSDSHCGQPPVVDLEHHRTVGTHHYAGYRGADGHPLATDALTRPYVIATRPAAQLTIADRRGGRPGRKADA
jgi:hypothetical protein